MRKLLKGIVVAIGIVLVVAIVGLAILWREATALPAWYAGTSDEGTREAVSESSPPVMAPLPDAHEEWVALEMEAESPQDATTPPAAVTRTPAPPAPRRASVDRHVLRNFHLRSGVAPDQTAIKASRAVLDAGKLEAGVVLDLSRVPLDTLPERDRALVQRAVEGFPGLGGRDVYVGIEDQPITRDGVLQLGPSPMVRVGNLRYSLESAARKLGLPAGELRQEFDRELRRLGITDPNQAKRKPSG